MVLPGTQQRILASAARDNKDLPAVSLWYTLPLAVESAENKCSISAAEAERIRQSDSDVRIPGSSWHIVQITFRVRF
ncbi:uncharacterized protein METZ01_LOCUS265037, partial [marine metagenome]